MGFPPDQAGLLDEVRECRAILEETADASDGLPRKKRAVALWRLGTASFRLGDFEDANEYLADAAVILWEFASLQSVAVQSWSRQAQALTVLGRHAESLEVVEKVIGAGKAVPENQETGVELGDVVAEAWALKGFLLLALERVGEAQAANDQLIEEFDPGATPLQRLIVAKAFVTRGRFLVHLQKKPDDALAALEEAIRRGTAEQSADFALTLAEAMLNKGSALESKGDIDEAVRTYDEVATRFGSSPDPAVRDTVAEAIEHRANLSVPTD